MINLRRNLAYKLLSLTIAVLLYVIATVQSAPHGPTEVFVTPEVTGIPSNLVLKGRPGGETVTVLGPASLVDAFRTQPIKATVDATGARPGVNRLAIAYNVPSSVRGRLTFGGPEFVTVELEERVSRSFSVDVLFDNTPPAGYIYNAPLSIPRRVTVSGGAAEAARVVRVVAPLDTTDTGGAIERTVTLVAQDSRERPVDTVTLSPPQAQVQITLTRTPATKTLLLSATPLGRPAPGYRLVGYRFRPDTVTVAGDQSRLARLSAVQIPVSVEGLKAPDARRIEVPAPAGLTIQGATTVEVHLEIVPQPGVAPAGRPSPATSPTPETARRPPAERAATETEKRGQEQ